MMSFNIKRITIQNYRGIKQAEIVLPEHSIILGSNNCGKTAIVEGIALTLGRERLLRNVDDYDFYGGFFDDTDPLAKRFFIKTVITGFEPNDPSQHQKWFNANDAGVEKWWDDQEEKLLIEQPEDLEDNQGIRYFLATEIGCCGYYDEDVGEYRVIRYFVEGECDPVIGDTHKKVRGDLFKDLGIFLLPSSRTWDKTLTFYASSFNKLLREAGAIPGEVITSLRKTLSNLMPSPERIIDHDGEEKNTEFGNLLASVEKEIKNTGLIPNDENNKLLYRPTSLDVRSILQSLIPHIKNSEGSFIPLGNQGSGLLALQNLLLLIEFARKRRDQDKSFIFLLEEPELHLYPNLQQKVTQHARGFSTQTIVTTHSPYVASSYAAKDVFILKNNNGIVSCEQLLPTNYDDSQKNLIKKYYYQEKLSFMSAIMGNSVIIPEGITDANWINLIKGLAERYESETHGVVNNNRIISPSMISIIRTKDARILETINELIRLGCKVLPLVDGDRAGKTYANDIVNSIDTIVVRWDDGEEIEDIISWIIEPSIDEQKEELQELFGITDMINISTIKRQLKDQQKKNLMFHEKLISLVSKINEVQERAWKLCSDLATISINYNVPVDELNTRWEPDSSINNCLLFKHE